MLENFRRDDDIFGISCTEEYDYLLHSLSQQMHSLCYFTTDSLPLSTCSLHATDEDGEEGDEGFFYDEEAALEGAAAADGRGQMLDHLDSLLQMPRADQLDDVSGPTTAQ